MITTFSINHDAQMLNQTFNYIPELQSKVSNVVVADIINQNGKLFAELGEEVIKQLLKRVLPIVLASILLGGVCILEGV